MGLSKAHLAALESWKKGEGEFPEALNTGHFFDNDDHLGRVVQTKLGPESKKVRQQVEAEILEIVGVTDPEQLKEIKHRLAEAAGTVTEVETLRSKLAKKEKDHAKDLEKLKGLEGFQVQVLKGRAIEPHLTKFAEPFRALVRENLEGKLTVAGDKILAPGEVEVEAFVEEFLKANPTLKVPETKAGAGTGPTGGKSQGSNAGAGAGNGGGQGGGAGGGSQNGTGGDPKFPKSFGGALVAVMKENAAKASGDSQ